MSSTLPAPTDRAPRAGQPPRGWWVHAGVAAAAMALTMPGRTHGLGLITEPLMADLALAKVPFGALNFWATLVGAMFCIPVGWALDRFGVRAVLAAILLAFGAAVLAMTGVQAGGRQAVLLTPELFFGGGLEYSPVPLDLFLLVLLTRGLGQAALSVVSLALVGKVAGKKPGLVIGVYSILVSLGFMIGYRGAQFAFERYQFGWRELWGGLGWTLVVSGALALLFVRNPRPAERAEDDAPRTPGERSYTLRGALLSPAFWVFGLATSFYGLVVAGMSLFGQSLLAERGFDRGVFLTLTYATIPIGLGANLAAGWLATKVRLGSLLGASLVIQTAALAYFPRVSTLAEIYVYSAAMGVSGGILTVVFFAVWRQAYGPVHLGKIQGAAQLLTVVASAAGPFVLAAGQRHYGSFAPVVQNFALTAAVFAVAAFLTPLPKQITTNPQTNEDEGTW